MREYVFLPGLFPSCSATQDDVKIGDFGLSTAINSTGHRTVVGTPFQGVASWTIGTLRPRGKLNEVYTGKHNLQGWKRQREGQRHFQPKSGLGHGVGSHSALKRLRNVVLVILRRWPSVCMPARAFVTTCGSTGWRVVNQRWPLIHRQAFSCAPIGFDQRVDTIGGKGQTCMDCVVSIIHNMPGFVSMCCYVSPVHPKGFFWKVNPPKYKAPRLSIWVDISRISRRALYVGYFNFWPEIMTFW